MILDRLFSKDDENLDAQRRDVDRILDHIVSLLPKGTLPELTSVDQLPGTRGSFGYSAGNPIPVNGPVGESVYIFRLRSRSGQKFYYQRLGFTKHVELNRQIDVFELVSTDGLKWVVLYFSMLHTRRSRKAPDGLSLASWREHAVPVGVMAKLGAFGETNHRSEDFPRCLPEYLRGNPLLQQAHLADILAEKMAGLLRDMSISPRPYSFVELCARLQPPGLGREEAAFLRSLESSAKPDAQLASTLLQSSRSVPPEPPAGPVANQTRKPAEILISGEGGPFMGIIMPIAARVSEYISQHDKETFARWARLPDAQWTPSFGERFALAFAYHIVELKERRAAMPPEFYTVAAELHLEALPPLDRPLTDEVRDVLGRFIAGRKAAD
jgi:hypothetical protein